jgi:hypothetical protein
MGIKFICPHPHVYDRYYLQPPSAWVISIPFSIGPKIKICFIYEMGKALNDRM